MSLDSTQIFILCLAAFITAVNAWVVFKLGTGGFHQNVTLLGHPYPPPRPPRGPRAPPPSPQPTSTGEPAPVKAVSDDGGSPVGCAPFLKNNRCRCHCQVTQVYHLHTCERRASGDGNHGRVSNLQPNRVPANHPHRVKNAKRRTKHRQSKC